MVTMLPSGSDTSLDDENRPKSSTQHAVFVPQAGGRVLLLEAKHNGLHSSTLSSASSSSSKELVSDALDFEIVELILNPTGKLLAVVGSHKVVILVLPRSGVYASKSIGHQVSVKAATVGSYYFHERIGGKARIASVKWHPWGHLGSSLLIMSKDGLLR
jgi:nucleoporin NUP82